MYSLFLLILLIPWHFLKFIPLFNPQTHVLFHVLIYLPVISQILSGRLFVISPIPTLTKCLIPQSVLRPISTSSYLPKRNANLSPRMFAQLLENYPRSSASSAKSSAINSMTYQYSIPNHRHSYPLTDTPLDEVSLTTIILVVFFGQRRETLGT
jgi:hypothetical protein